MAERDQDPAGPGSERTIEDWRALLRRAPGDAGMWHDYARALWQAKRHGDAVEAMNRAAALAPDTRGIRIDQVRLLTSLGTDDAAALAAARAAARLPRPSYERAGALDDIVALLEAGRPMQLRRALALDPANKDAAAELGNLLHRLGCLAEALDVYREMLEHHPGDIHAMRLVASTLSKLQLAEEAIAVWRGIIGREPYNGAVLYVLAEGLRKLGRVEEARPYALRARENLPTDDAEMPVLLDRLGLAKQNPVDDYGTLWPGDPPASVSPAIAAFMQAWDRHLRDSERDALLRPLLPLVLNTNGSPGVQRRRAERRRSLLAADWLVWTYAPAWLRLAGSAGPADTLAALPEMAEVAQWRRLLPVLEAVCGEVNDVEVIFMDVTANATGKAAFDAVWDVAWDAGAGPKDAARDTAWAATLKAVERWAEEPHWDDVWSALYSTAWVAASDAVGMARNPALDEALGFIQDMVMGAVGDAIHTAEVAAVGAAVPAMARSIAAEVAAKAVKAATLEDTLGTARGWVDDLMHDAIGEVAPKASAAALAATCLVLQQSALDLVRRMVAVTKAG